MYVFGIFAMLINNGSANIVFYVSSSQTTRSGLRNCDPDGMVDDDPISSTPVHGGDRVRQSLDRDSYQEEQCIPVVAEIDVKVMCSIDVFINRQCTSALAAWTRGPSARLLDFIEFVVSSVVCLC
jgi:hypothetical protein